MKALTAAALCLCMLMQRSDLLMVEAGNFYQTYGNVYNQLFVPTQLTKIGDEFYLVDSYHNQILTSNKYDASVSSWQTMVAGSLNQPHAIAGDGVVYVVVDTENHRVVSYAKAQGGYMETQVFENIGLRPHYVEYDGTTGVFYVWSSLTGEMYLFKRKPNTVELSLQKVMRVPELYGQYARSFTIVKNRIYFPCVTSSSILEVDKKTFRIKNNYPVPENIAGMVQLLKIQNYYYLTILTDSKEISAPNMVRAAKLEDFAAGNYQSVLADLGTINGAPYYISYADGNYFAASAGGSRYKFNVVNDVICNVQVFPY